MFLRLIWFSFSEPWHFLRWNRAIKGLGKHSVSYHTTNAFLPPYPCILLSKLSQPSTSIRGLQTENLHSVGCLQPFSVRCSFSWLPRSRVVFLGAGFWKTALQICKSGRGGCVCAILLFATTGIRKQRHPEQQKGEALRNCTFLPVCTLVLSAIILTSNFYPFTCDLRMCCIAGSAVNY